MLQKLYEQIDSKVLTADVRESLEREFAAAVDSKASAIADSRVEEIEAELQEQQQQRIHDLDEAAIEYQNQLKAEYDKLNKAMENEIHDHKLMLNEMAQKYIDERLEGINHMIDLYASRVADDIMESTKEVIVDSNTVLKTQAMYEALNAFAKMAGYNLGLEINESAKKANDQYNSRINELIEENRSLKDQVKSLENNLIFEQTTKDLSMYQQQRMRMSVAGIIDTIDGDTLKTNLMNLKESYNSEPELDFRDDKRGTEISDLLFKNIN